LISSRDPHPGGRPAAAQGAENVANLNMICSRDITRENLRHPFWITFCGEKWAAACDGRAAVAIFKPIVDPVGDQDTDSATSEALEKMLNEQRPTPPVVVSVAELREWAGSPMWPHVCHCAECDKVFDENPPDIQYGKFGRALCFDRKLVARVLSTLPGEIGSITASVAGEYDFLRLQAPGWVALVMPCRMDEAATEMATAHTFPLPEPEVKP